MLADDYVLTHKNSFNYKPDGLSQKSDKYVRLNNCNFKGTPRNVPQNTRSGNRMVSFPTGPEFYHCRKKGHVMADCWYLKGSGQNTSDTKSNMLVANAQPQVTVSQSPVKISRPTDEYTPFYFQDNCVYPRLSGCPDPCYCFADTGASQSLLLKDKLQETNTYTGSDV